ARHFSLSRDELSAINPNTRTAPTFRNKREAEIAKGIYRRVKAWCLHEQSETWPGTPKTPFNMSNDSGLFLDESTLRTKGILVDNFGCGYDADRVYLPLYESKLIHQFNHRYSTFGGLP